MHHVYAANFVTLAARFESSIEDLFIGTLWGRYRKAAGTQPRVEFKSPVVAREVVLGGRPYADWLPYDLRTERLAGVYFAGGRPFSNLTKADKQVLQRLSTVRNAIAHDSRSATDRFEKEVLSNAALPPRERSPAAYLRSVLRTSPLQRRYENEVIELASILKKLCV